MLEVKALNAFYGPVQVLHDINLSVPSGQIVGLVGANAAGKSTLMFTLAGLRTTHTGDILLDGQSVSGLPAYERVSRGLVLVPERRRLFPFMTVLENLEIGAYSPCRALESRASPARRSSRCCRCWPSGEAGRRLAQRRRAADAGHRPRADGQAARAAARRADRGARADLRQAAVRPDRQSAQPTA